MAQQLFDEYGVSKGVPFKDALYSDEKEHPFFTTVMESRWRQGLSYYATGFPPCGEGVLTLDGHPNYSQQPAALERLKRLYGPERLSRTTFAMVLCDPVQRAHSAFYYVGANGSFRPSNPSRHMWYALAQGRYGRQLDAVLDWLGHVVIVPSSAYFVHADTVRAALHSVDTRLGCTGSDWI
jgi:hypothetical protein